MSDYLALIITAVLIAGALAWWLVSLKSVSKPADTPKSEAPPKAVDAPPVAATPPPKAEKAAAKKKVVVAPLMDDPKPTPRNAPPKPQAPLKAAATKAAPTKTAQPAAKKTVAPKTAVGTLVAPKSLATKVAAPKPKGTAKVVLADNLGLMKGVGPKLSTLLQSLGVTSFAQVANWSVADIADIDAKLGNFAGRIGRDNWVDQAKLLGSGDIAGFEKKYGALGSEIKKV